MGFSLANRRLSPRASPGEADRRHRHRACLPEMLTVVPSANSFGFAVTFRRRLFDALGFGARIPCACNLHLRYRGKA
jgi:hypothetical protein